MAEEADGVAGRVLPALTSTNESVKRVNVAQALQRRSDRDRLGEAAVPRVPREDVPVFPPEAPVSRQPAAKRMTLAQLAESARKKPTPVIEDDGGWHPGEVLRRGPVQQPKTGAALAGSVLKRMQRRVGD